MKIAILNKKFELKLRQILIRVITLLMLNNLVFYAFFWPEQSENLEFQMPEGYSKIQIKADLKTPFEEGKLVTLSDINLKTRISHALLISESTLDDERIFQVAVPNSSVELALKITEFSILPPIKQMMKHREKHYEISF